MRSRKDGATDEQPEPQDVRREGLPEEGSVDEPSDDARGVAAPLLHVDGGWLEAALSAACVGSWGRAVSDKCTEGIRDQVMVLAMYACGLIFKTKSAVSTLDIGSSTQNRSGTAQCGMTTYCSDHA